MVKRKILLNKIATIKWGKKLGCPFMLIFVIAKIIV
jgi:hypothetical protein